jgi:hypothetical protein
LPKSHKKLFTKYPLEQRWLLLRGSWNPAFSRDEFDPPPPMSAFVSTVSFWQPETHFVKPMA